MKNIKIIIKNLNKIIYTINEIILECCDDEKKIKLENILLSIKKFINKIKENEREYIFSSEEYEDQYNLLNDLKLYDKFAEGVNRDVFICNNNDIIVKKDKYSVTKSCFREFLFWIIIKNTYFRKYFVPCVAISKNFDEIIMLKMDDNKDKININDGVKNEIENFCHSFGFTDIGVYGPNCGLLDDNIIICDYGQNIKHDEIFFGKIINNIIS